MTIWIMIVLILPAGCGDAERSGAAVRQLPPKKIAESSAGVSMVCDRFGRLFVADAAGGTVSCVHENGVRAVLAEGLGDISGLVIDGAGNALVCSRTKGTVYRIKPDGTVVPAAEGLKRPYELAVDRDGNIYAATEEGIWRIPRSGPGFM